MVTEKLYYVYIMTNAKHTVLYTGFSNDLKARVWSHKGRFVEGFTKKYHVDMLMYYEATESVVSALERERQIKAGSRQKKIDLINSINPGWRDLYDDLETFVLPKKDSV
jgi:putative endonuclease